MKATGIVRRIDELGRVVIPKEIRRTLRIREGDPLEIFTDHDGEVVLKKYSPIGEIANIAKDYTDSLYRTLGHIVCICDRDAVVSSTGGAKRELVEKPLSQEVESILQNRQMAVLNVSAGAKTIPVTNDDRADSYSAQLVMPILADGDHRRSDVAQPGKRREHEHGGSKGCRSHGRHHRPADGTVGFAFFLARVV